MTITADELRTLLNYDDLTGVFTRKVDVKCGNGRLAARAGDIAGGARPDGYQVISVAGKRFLAHRLAWLHVHGQWPSKWLDHVDGDRSNNRIANLRECDPLGNNRNQKLRPSSSTGFKGVAWHSIGKRYTAKIRANGKRIHLGMFDTPEEAHRAYCEAAKKYHGEFARMK